MNEDLLRRALAAHADRIEPQPDALGSIQRRIRAGGAGRAAWAGWAGRAGSDRRGSGWRRWVSGSPLAVGAVTVATATVVAVTAGLLGGVPLGPPQRQPQPVGGSAAPTQPASPSSEASAPATVPPDTPSQPDPTRTPAAGPVGGTSTASVAVYYQGADRQRARLYREFHRLPVGDGSAAARVTAALRNLLDGPTGMDPDYYNGWPATAEPRRVSVSGGVATVDLAGAAKHDVPERTARQAVAQLVWTVTAVPGVTGVRLRLDGAPVDRLWGQVDVSGTLRRAPAVDVLAPVWLVSPQHGDVVGRTFEVHIAGIVPEATAQLRVRQGSRTVTEEVVTLSIAGPAQGEKRLKITLPPGRYVLTAYATSLADGSEQHLDDHTVTVR